MMVGDGLNSPRQQGGKEAPDEIMAPFPDKYKMRNTRVLEVKDCKLKELPEHVVDTACTEFVNIVCLENSQLTDVPSTLYKMNELLTCLELPRNQLSSLPTAMSQFSRLVSLNVSCNLLRELPMELGGLQLLCELDISHNRFAEIPRCIFDLENLETLTANDNQIRQIDATENGLGCLYRLNQLDLSNNNIEFVPPVLGNLTNINELKLCGNPFRQPRHQILSLGTSAIMKYLRGRIPE